MKYIFEILWICWLLSEILLNRLVRSKNPDSKVVDKNSLNLIWIAIVVSMTLGIFCANYWFVRIIPASIALYLGSGIIIAGMIIRFTAVWSLGKFFTVNLGIQDNHRLVRTGLYKYIRHPSYSGSLLSFAGFCLSLDNWLSLFIILIPVIATFINRINIEETLLLGQFGPEYEEYKRKTKRLIPLIY